MVARVARQVEPEEPADEDHVKVPIDTSRLTDKQKLGIQLLQGAQRYTLFKGGARSAKTFDFIYSILVRAQFAPKSRHATIRLNANAARQSLALDTIPKVREICFPKLEWEHKRADGYFLLSNESELWYGGVEDEEATDKILGKEYVTILLNECSQIPYLSVLKIRSRLAQVVMSKSGRPLVQRMYLDLNPVGKSHYSYKLFSQHVDPHSNLPLSDPDNYKQLVFHPEDNKQNLTPEFIEDLKKLPKRLRQRFYEGVDQDEVEDALWQTDMIEQHRVLLDQVPHLVRVVVAVDPSGAGSIDDTTHDMIGIVVVGVGDNGHAYVLADHSCHDGPAGWAAKVKWVYEEYNCDRVLGETNFGGAMVENTIKTTPGGKHLPFKEVKASRAKHIRAEPVAALYETRESDEVYCRVHHVVKPMDDGRDHLMSLEGELYEFTTTGYGGEKSPNRADALIMAVTELMLGESVQGWVDFYSQLAKNKGVLVAPTPTKRELEKNPPPAHADLRAPGPNMIFVVGANVKYQADGEGMIKKVDPAHIKLLEVHGCKRE